MSRDIFLYSKRHHFLVSDQNQNFGGDVFSPIEGRQHKMSHISVHISLFIDFAIQDKLKWNFWLNLFSALNSMADKFVWNRESVNLLIENYRKRPLLYNPKHHHYKNRNKRLEALEEILNDVDEKCPFAANQGLNTDDIKQKIHTLRTQYFKEVNKIKEYTSIDQLYIPKLWCFEKLSFLEKCGAVRNNFVYVVSLIFF